MKSSEEVIRDVFQKRDACLLAEKKRKKKIITVAVPSAAALLAASAVIGFFGIRSFKRYAGSAASVYVSGLGKSGSTGTEAGEAEEAEEEDGLLMMQEAAEENAAEETEEETLAPLVGSVYDADAEDADSLGEEPVLMAEEEGNALILSLADEIRAACDLSEDAVCCTAGGVPAVIASDGQVFIPDEYSESRDAVLDALGDPEAYYQSCAARWSLGEILGE